MMDFVEAQTEFVRQAVASVSQSSWERIFIDLEIREFDDGFDTDYVAVVIVVREGRRAFDQFMLNRDARAAASALYQQRKDDAGETIGGFEVAIDPDGRYRFNINHGKPERLNGIWNQERQGWIDDYLSHYEQELQSGEISWPPR